ncbi:MAG: methylmalonyl Co-A mutase-associated GTPase MeaB [Bacteroidetes bacterium]|nr:methylmalonyl Co-A mutase-associated GTPase MeaB [Bacteroidota bacterium]MBU1718689.1 methylmalonyl Co-A mutase-associated GTPase MeaB [Bacteroidota bacterium]
MDEDEKNPGFGLKVNAGIEQPSQINPDAIDKIKRRKAVNLHSDEYLKGIVSGDRTILARAITLVESSLDDHRKSAGQLIEKCIPYSGKSIRIGITGVPGAGKSTLIEALGKLLTLKGHKVAVLAIDPSSEISKGSILGDKTRMEELAVDRNAFIRPSPSAGTLGGVARKTRESVLLCEAAGFDVIFIETVGVGQSETAVHSMVDFFLLVLIPGGGDELQGIKRGIMEMADAILINKAEGENIHRANEAKQNYTNALHLMPPSHSGWIPLATTCSALQNQGIPEIWDMILKYSAFTKANGYFDRRREEQDVKRMRKTLQEELSRLFEQTEGMAELIRQAETDIQHKRVTSYSAAYNLINEFIMRTSK